MKTILTIIISVLAINITIAQNPNNAPFLGTWEFQENNKIFRINIWENQTNDGIDGHYWLIELDANGNETIIDQSDKEKIDGCNCSWSEAFSAYSKDGEELRGLIRDVTPLPKDRTWIDGLLSMSIQENNPTAAHWIVSYDGPIYFEARFQIPTNCILTKVE
ncbi:DUF6705 family protein [Olleya namhaensis]|uniref:DUF6705 family protein n=1 Tax=Olleya namhaensis TaxID=1144750 RepID=UPI0024922D1B|nr:DUF6705 family protein [Olleya namhaensis]